MNENGFFGTLLGPSLGQDRAWVHFGTILDRPVSFVFLEGGVVDLGFVFFDEGRSHQTSCGGYFSMK